MPGMDGREFGERLAARAPNMPVLYMSAYTEDEIVRRHMLPPTKPLLQKPLSASRLAEVCGPHSTERSSGNSRRPGQPGSL